MLHLGLCHRSSASGAGAKRSARGERSLIPVSMHLLIKTPGYQCSGVGGGEEQEDGCWGKMGSIASARGCRTTATLHLVSPGSAAERPELGFVQ